MLALGDTAEEAFYSIFHLQAACEVQVSARLVMSCRWAQQLQEDALSCARSQPLISIPMH